MRAASSAGQTGFLKKYFRPEMAGLPKFMQLRKLIVSAIEDGYWRRGAKLPGEQAIAEMSPYSLGTVQKALNLLVDEGILTRRLGSGTFVNAGRREMDSPWHVRFFNDDRSGFLPVYSMVLSRERIRESGPWSPYLKQKGNNVVRIVRRFDVNHEFEIFSQVYLNTERAGSIMKRPLADLQITNFKRVLQEECRLPITHISQAIRIAKFPHYVCRALHLKVRSSGIVLTAVASVGKNDHLYFHEFFIPLTNRELCVSESYTAGATSARLNSGVSSGQTQRAERAFQVPLEEA